MTFKDIIKKASNIPLFTIGLLAAGENVAQVRLQVARWVKDGRLIKLHKGLYQLADPYIKIIPEKFTIANKIKSHSYVSLQSALAYHDMIPEYVAEVTSVTAGRPQTIETPVGRFSYRHIKKNLFNGFRLTELSSGQYAFIAVPEKALLDLVYLNAHGESEAYLEELRLQNLDKINKKILRKIALESGIPKLKRAFSIIEKIIGRDKGIEL
ncbi:MAG: hypothetical protein A3F16_04540 [Deltaproteobacteria bacterium RIFCSPHIGHO2_12_FULL_43_9]|nr:MAG: hypothetical protein A3F16_04540 [Deltaproteobacteria bacterium RIFCSPHIGHO2_12_FULL_43_9]